MSLTLHIHQVYPQDCMSWQGDLGPVLQNLHGWLLHHGLFHRLRRNFCSGTWSHLILSFLLWPRWSQGYSSHFFTHSLAGTAFLSFLKYTLTKTSLLFTNGLSCALLRNHLEMAVPTTGQALASSHRLPQQPPCQHLTTQPLTPQSPFKCYTPKHTL